MAAAQQNKTVSALRHALRGVAILGVILTLTPAPVSAGNGNGNGNSNRNNDRSNRDNDRGNNGRGQEARNLRGANAANANQNALANAAPNSTPARLAIYRDAVLQSGQVIQQQNLAAQELVRLQSLTQAQIAAEFPMGGYDAALSAAMSTYQTLTAQAQNAEATRTQSLMQLTGGRELSQTDLAALHRMLGL